MNTATRGRSVSLLCVALGLVACSEKQVDSRAAQFARLPDWSGIWVSAEPIAKVDISGYPTLADPLKDWQVLGFNAPYNDAGKAALEQFMAQAAQVGQTQKSVGWNFPQMMEAPTPLQFTITPDETLIVNFYRDVRHVYTDGRDHPAEQDRWPTPWGDSVGYWEGDTLVIDTLGVERPTVGLDLPLVSEQARYVERLRKTAADRIESEITVTDPATLSQPWVIKLAYMRAPALDRMFHNLFDNDRDSIIGDGLTIDPPKTAGP